MGTAVGSTRWRCPPIAEPAEVGTALVRHVEKALVALSCQKINLQVLEHNAGVVSFYEKLGYKVEPRVSMGKAVGSFWNLDFGFWIGEIGVSIHDCRS